MKRAGLFLAVLLGGCGLRGGAPAVKAPSVLGKLAVEGRDGAVRVSFVATPKNSAETIEGYDVLRRVETPGERTFFERIGTLPAGPKGAHPLFFVDEKLADGATYHYRVRPRFAGEPPAQSLKYAGPEEIFTWHAPPPPPDDVKATPLHLAARLTWDPVPGVTGYRVYSVDSAGHASAEPASRGTIEHESWTPVALQDGVTVRYVVRSVLIPERASEKMPAPEAVEPEVAAPSGVEVADAASQGVSIPTRDVGGSLRKVASQLIGEGALPGIESRSSPPVAVTPGFTAPPPPPHQLKLAIVSSGAAAPGVALSWRPSQGEEVVGYFVERRDVRGNELSLFKRLTPQAVVGSGWVDIGVTKGATYEYQVRAVDASGNEGKPTDPKKITFTP